MSARSTRPFAAVKKWRAKDQHTGIGKSDGVPYTYEHVAPSQVSRPRADVYRVETYVPYAAPTPLRDVYYVPARQLHHFVDTQFTEEYFITVLDIRPLTTAEALAEITAFRAAAEKGLA